MGYLKKNGAVAPAASGAHVPAHHRIVVQGDAQPIAIAALVAIFPDFLLFGAPGFGFYRHGLAQGSAYLLGSFALPDDLSHQVIDNGWITEALQQILALANVSIVAIRIAQKSSAERSDPSDSCCDQ